MPQFDVYRTVDGALLIDCQSNAFGDLDSRFMVPLTPVDRSPPGRARLNPTFVIDGEHYMMVTQFAAAVRVRDVRTPVTSLAAYRFDIIGAIDMLLTGV